MFSDDKDTGTLWRAGEMGYGRNHYRHRNHDGRAAAR